MHRIGSTALVLLVLTCGLAAHAQDAPAWLRLTHVVPGAPPATLLVDGVAVMQSPAATAGDAYLEIAPGTPSIAVEVDGVRSLAEPVHLRSGFRYLAVAHEAADGSVALVVVPGPAGRLSGTAVSRVVNLVEELTTVRAFLHETCDGRYRMRASAYGTAAQWETWEYNHTGAITVCSEDMPLEPPRQRPEDGPWILRGRVMAIYVVRAASTPAVLLVDETP